MPASPETPRRRPHIASMDDDTVFRALADASRRQLLDRLHQRNGQTLGELRQGLDMTRQAVAKHLAVLEEANLVSWKRQGREKLHFINPVPINQIAERWISKFELPRLRALSELKKDLEESTMTEAAKSSFVYVTYNRTMHIRLTPKKTRFGDEGQFSGSLDAHRPAVTAFRPSRIGFVSASGRQAVAGRVYQERGKSRIDLGDCRGIYCVAQPG
jgi:DNA-binding transcriptional ArsR family regulator